MGPLISWHSEQVRVLSSIGLETPESGYLNDGLCDGYSVVDLNSFWGEHEASSSSSNIIVIPDGLLELVIFLWCVPRQAMRLVSLRRVA